MCSIAVHPTIQSVNLFEILQGKYAYVKGQTLYSSVRNSGTFFRQVFTNIYRDALSSCTYEDVLQDWIKYETSIRQRWKPSEKEDNAFKWSTFQSWFSTMKMTIDGIITKAITYIINTKCIASYERYIDWVATCGVVPVLNQRPNSKVVQMFKKHLEKEYSSVASSKSLTTIFHFLVESASSVLERLTSKFIPSYLEVSVTYDQYKCEYKASYQNKEIGVEVIIPPTIGSGKVVFNSPVQRLAENVMACHRTMEHAKICQLLNTGPLKAIVCSSSATVYKDILNHLDECGKKNDPKKELMQLLIKLAENKTVNGVTDVVEDFITDVSNKLVDRSKLFGDVNAEHPSDNLKKQVSNNVFKCLTQQINQQFETISKLEEERAFFLKKINQIETQLSKCQEEPQGTGGKPYNILTSSTLDALDGLSQSGLHLTSNQVTKGQSIVNSFFSQYVPPFRELQNDLHELWEHEIMQSFNLSPIIDNQGQRLFVRYTQDTIFFLLGPFTHNILGFVDMELLIEAYCTLSFYDIAEYLYSASRLAIYIVDIGQKYCSQPNLSDGSQS
ncbi:minor capsid protein [Alcelaphine gammaherpesvirus 1]|uniref:Portal protein n=1 Tax=Alcelaphine herpesvirus 1 (strain C500) TaxID=654901 RepID=PORTL_ALHV1|nr:minor capsid protein [Alcelaphine gammaherpesvirus 1]O36392.1 RecName: Full=Portal protein [Alcelaphine herpesvirus 1 strain C500]AAC58089.1 minor capsid protein [Alcelaphine gammaherpesvirus 1]APB09467.1 capsid portal protein [Alcelaphine gammaherpesvirus 1]APB09539.1 capsid portal protein [Alcelaphine gammaherpesvirus 1]